MSAVLQARIDGSSAVGQWLAPLQSWPAAALAAVLSQGCVARIVIAAVRGSSPREVGTSMLVERERIFGTIGGGQLEWAAIAATRAMLAETASASVRLDKLILGPQLSQCCGGAVELWMERFTTADIPFLISASDNAAREPATLTSTVDASGTVARTITRRLGDRRVEFTREDDIIRLREPLDDAQPSVWLYGAGHVGQALTRVLATLPLRLTWIDSRAELLPSDPPQPVQTLLVSDPVATVADAPRGTHFLVMTHSHPLDYALCKAVLERDDNAWLGVIGSNSKSVRFRSRLLHDGLSREQVDRLICPIGIAGIDSKLPAVIAVSVATQLMQAFSAPARSTRAEAHDCANGGCSRCALQSGGTQ